MTRSFGNHYKKRAGVAWRAVAGAGIVAGSLFAVGASASPAHAATSLLDMGGTIQYDGNGAAGWSNSGAPTDPTTCTINQGVDIAGSQGLFDCGAVVGTEGAPFPVTNQTPSLQSSVATANGVYASSFIIDQLNDSYTDCGAPKLSQGSNIFGGGDKFTDDPSADTWSLGNADAKNEISNAYAVAAQSGADRQVSVGLERVDNNGDTHVDFQFLHAAVGQTGTANCSGSFTGAREQGDVALQIDYSNGGDNPTPALLVWSCDGTVPTSNSQIGELCSAGNKSNAGWVAEPECTASLTSGCYQAGAVSIATNGTKAVPCGAWICRTDQANQVTQVTSVATNEFMEGTVDLDALGFNFGCSATFWPVTRAAAGNGQSDNPSPAQTSQLKAMAPPAGFQTCESTTTTTSVTPATVQFGGSVTDTATVSRPAGTTGTPTGSVAFYACGPFQTQPTTDPVCTSASPNATHVGTATTPLSHTDTTATFTSGAGPSDQAGWYCFDAEYTPTAGLNLQASDDQSTQAATECYQVLTPPSISAQKSENPSDPAIVAPGRTIDYTITVSNSGQSDATGVSVSDTVPAHTTFVSADNGGTQSGGTVTWSNLTVPGGGSTSVHFSVKVDADATQSLDIPNTAEVTSNYGQCDGQTCPTNTVHETVLYPVVEANKTQTPPSGSTVNRGSRITYTITVANYGLADALDVPVTDTVPTGTTFVSATNGGVDNSGTITWTLADLVAGTLAPGATTVTPGASQTVSFTVTVDSADTTGQIIRNVADYENVHNPDPACATAATCPTNEVTATVAAESAPQQVTTTSSTSTTQAPVNNPPPGSTTTAAKHGLAFTGADVFKTVAGGLLMGVGGVALVLASRRRRPRRDS